MFIMTITMLTTLELIQEKLINYFQDTEMWMNILFILIQVVIIWIASRIVLKVVKKAILHMATERERYPLKYDPRRTLTISRLITNLVRYTVNFIAVLLILDQLGFELMPLLAGAGVVGLAIGFGAQSLVRDTITGFFIIFEDQFAVGDVIETGGVKGTVEEIGIRVTKIKSWTGEIHIIPNGAIEKVANFSIYNSIAVVDISIAYEQDIDTAVKVIKESADRVFKDNENMVVEPDVLGVQALGNSDVVIRVTAECKPNTHFGVGRLLNADIKKSLDAKDIEIPYPRLVTFQRTEKAE